MRGALSVGYTGAGTMEFLLDHDGNLSFMEMNARIQVEHPVSEMITSVDLIQEQIRVAAGEPLSVTQDDVKLRGHAIECRVNAEDPDRDFAPAAGRLDVYVPPGGPWTRVDSHCYAGWTIAPFYDSLIAKLIVWAPTRLEAIERMDRALLRVSDQRARRAHDDPVPPPRAGRRALPLRRCVDRFRGEVPGGRAREGRADLTDAEGVGALSLQVTAGPAAGQAIVVEERLVIGRHSDGPGRLAEDPELSRHHAQISRQADGAFAIEDLASTNGTIVNGTRITAPTALHARDSIELGGTTMIVANAPSPASEPGVDARAATVTVNVPSPMRGVGPATQESSPAPPPPTEPVAPPPPPEPLPPTEPELPPTEAAPPPPPPPPPPEPPTAEAEPVAAEPEPAAPEPPAPTPLPLDEVSRDQSVPYLPYSVPPAHPPVPEHEDELPARSAGPALPRLSLQLVVDAERGQVEIRLDDDSAPIRLGLVDGRWRVVDGGE